MPGPGPPQGPGASLPSGGPAPPSPRAAEGAARGGCGSARPRLVATRSAGSSEDRRGARGRADRAGDLLGAAPAFWTGLLQPLGAPLHGRGQRRPASAGGLGNPRPPAWARQKAEEGAPAHTRAGGGAMQRAGTRRGAVGAGLALVAAVAVSSTAMAPPRPPHFPLSLPPGAARRPRRALSPYSRRRRRRRLCTPHAPGADRVDAAAHAQAKPAQAALNRANAGGNPYGDVSDSVLRGREKTPAGAASADPLRRS